MKWASHIAIGGAVTFAFEPALVPVGILGSTAPDWLEFVVEKIGKPVKHRTVTHYASIWMVLPLFALVVWDFQGVILWFGIGGLTHVLADSLTVTGVPLGWWSDRRFHLFGGRIRTGRPSEYVVAGGVVVVCGGFAWFTQSSSFGFVPFFFDWAGYYDQGLVDGFEWKQNRWRWF